MNWLLMINIALNPYLDLLTAKVRPIELIKAVFEIVCIDGLVGKFRHVGFQVGFYGKDT